MKKVGFALLSSSRDPAPSTRIACLNLFPHLRAAGFDPEVVFDPSEASEVPEVSDVAARALAIGAKIVVFQKIHGPSVLQAVTRLRSERVGTVYCACDWVDNEMAAATDATIVPTSFLKSLYHAQLHDRIQVVHDGIERPEIVRKAGSRTTKATLAAGLVTSHPLYRIPVLDVPPRGWRVDVVGRFPPRSRLLQRVRSAYWALSALPDESGRLALLKALLHPRIRHTPWDPAGVYERLQQCDVGIIPVDASVNASEPNAEPPWKIKSENRLTLKMALGLPVIATPIPSYEAVVQHGVNAFFARSRSDWLDCLHRLRDPDLRREMGIKARQSVLTRYSLEAQAELFIGVLESFKLAPFKTPFTQALA
jgi:glycosyltransferase involved in cell wall biosynthesis